MKTNLTLSPGRFSLTRATLGKCGLTRIHFLAKCLVCACGFGGAFGNLQLCAQGVAPTNDMCSGAVVLADNVYYAENTATATDDTGLPCSYNGTVYKGVWFAYTAVRTGTLTVDTCPSTFDTKMEMFSGTCGSPTSLGCNDDACGVQSMMSLPCVAGTTYHICAGGFNGASGNLQIRARAVTPTNGTCVGAISLTENVYYPENTGTATNLAGLPCAGTISKGVWFAYTAVITGTLIADTCPSTFDTKIELFSGACSSLSSLGCNDNGCGLQSMMTVPCVAGATYHICAGGSGGASGDLWVRARAVALANDTSAKPVALTDAVYYEENTVTATDDSGLPCSYNGTVYKGVWFTYTAVRTGTLTVDTCPSTFDTKMEMFSGSYGSLDSLGCNDDACGLQSMMSLPCVLGTTYYICAGGFDGASGNLQIRAQAAPPRPKMTVTSAGGNVVIAWPTNFTGFTLNSATNLVHAPVSWSVAPPPPTIVNGMYTVTNRIVGSARYFELR